MQEVQRWQLLYEASEGRRHTLQQHTHTLELHVEQLQHTLHVVRQHITPPPPRRPSPGVHKTPPAQQQHGGFGVGVDTRAQHTPPPQQGVAWRGSTVPNLLHSPQAHPLPTDDTPPHCDSPTLPSQHKGVLQEGAPQEGAPQEGAPQGAAASSPQHKGVAQEGVARGSGQRPAPLGSPFMLAASTDSLPWMLGEGGGAARCLHDGFCAAVGGVGGDAGVGGGDGGGNGSVARGTHDGRGNDGRMPASGGKGGGGGIGGGDAAGMVWAIGQSKTTTASGTPLPMPTVPSLPTLWLTEGSPSLGSPLSACPSLGAGLVCSGDGDGVESKHRGGGDDGVAEHGIADKHDVAEHGVGAAGAATHPHGVGAAGATTHPGGHTGTPVAVSVLQRQVQGLQAQVHMLQEHNSILMV